MKSVNDNGENNNNSLLNFLRSNTGGSGPLKTNKFATFGGHITDENA